MKFGILQIRREIEMIVIEFFEWLGSLFLSLIMLILLCVHFFALYLSLIKWFNTSHWSFWHGAKELLMSVCPVVNLFYSGLI